MKKVAVIGAGLQAHRRLQPILDDKEYAVPLIVDLYEERAQMLAKSCDAAVSSNWRDAVNDPGIDAILLLTYPDSHAKIAIAAMKKGKDVLCEKPLARTETEAKKMIKVAHETKRILKCGFNHRHHPAVVEMHKLFESGLIGKAVFGRGRYGIAGRSGVEKEWRSNPKIVSGGQLMEQGIHLVDLYRWFLGDMTKATGMVATNYWPMQPLEDNAFAVMQNKDGVMVSIHSSLTQWINLFEFELYGEKGSLVFQNLGASYGTEKLIISEHDPNKPFSYKTIEYRGGDSSWKNEWLEFTKAVTTRKEPLGNGEDGYRAIQIVNAVYKASKTGRTIDLT